MKQNGIHGDGVSFDKNWKEREELNYNHWVIGEPQNQIQLAFRMHWNLFSEIISQKSLSGKNVLEVGCGRATISSYFSSNGFKTTCLDISKSVLDSAKSVFSKNQLQGDFIQGDALDLPFQDKTFDVIVSIGLLEHFVDVDKLLSEQARVLAPGGLFLGYVVPEYKDGIQNDYNWINDVLRGYSKNILNVKEKNEKTEVFRSSYDSAVYAPVLEKNGIGGIQSCGVYPLPMISPSVDFPFTLMPPAAELELVKHFQRLLNKRFEKTKRNPWICEEGQGQAFLIWGWKN